MARGGEPTELYLILQVAGSPAGLEGIAAAANATGRVATILLEPDATTPPTPSDLATLVAAIQKLGLATLVSGDASLARIVNADGVHLPPSKTIMASYTEARETLGSRFIVGIDAGRSRHDAMSLGETGADYIGFGIPPHVEDRDTARERSADLIAWWSEIFEVPCIAFDVETPEEAEDLVRAGADYIALRLPAGLATADVPHHLAPFTAVLDLEAAVS